MRYKYAPQNSLCVVKEGRLDWKKGTEESTGKKHRKFSEENQNLDWKFVFEKC